MIARCLLALTLQTLALAASAAPCETPYVAVGNSRSRKELPADHPACGRIAALKADYQRLTRAAGLADGEIPLVITDDPTAFGGTLYRDARVIALPRGMLERPALSREAALAILSHELGHEVGQRGGSTQAQREGQADAIGAELLLRAGFPPSTARQGWENISSWDCERTLKPRNPKSTHPSRVDRVRNAAAAAAVARVLSEARFLDDGGRRPSGEYVSVFRLDDVSPAGSLNPQAALDRAIRASRVKARPKLAIGPGAGVPSSGRVRLTVPLPWAPSIGVGVTVSSRFFSIREHLRARAERFRLRAAAEQIRRSMGPSEVYRRIAAMCRVRS